MSKIASLALMASAASATEYIVQMQQGASTLAMFRHFESHGIASSDLMHEYNINNGEFVGYAFKGSENQRLSIAEDPSVLLVEENQEVRALCTEQQQPAGLYGLATVTNFGNGRVSRIDANYGRGVSAYILDTGVLYSHNEFPNTGSNCFSAINNEACGTDRNGHGTHVAGTVAGRTYGVAPAATLIDVKVLSGSGSGTNAGVIAGVDFTARDCSGDCTGNMSLGGGVSTALNNAVIAAANGGVSMVLASGNSNADACRSSPAGAGGAQSANVITVNSSDNNNRRSSFSNWGTCTDVFAPGSNILSAWIGSNTASRTISGTSMASPHVAGVVTAILGNNPGMSPANLKAALNSGALPNQISDPRNGSPNMLAQVTC